MPESRACHLRSFLPLPSARTDAALSFSKMEVAANCSSTSLLLMKDQNLVPC